MPFSSAHEQSAQSNLSRDQLFLIPCIPGRVLQITDGGHLQRLEVFKASIAWKWPCKHRRLFPVQHRGRWPRNARSRQNLSFCGYDTTCAAPSLLIAVPRALAMSTPALSLMPVQFRSLCHGRHTLGLPHPVFFHLPHQHNRAQSDARYGFGNLPVLNVMF